MTQTARPTTTPTRMDALLHDPARQAFWLLLSAVALARLAEKHR